MEMLVGDEIIIEIKFEVHIFDASTKLKKLPSGKNSSFRAKWGPKRLNLWVVVR